MTEDLEELTALHQEFEWLLKGEVNDIFSQLHDMVLECSRRFPIQLDNKKIESKMRSEKYTFNVVNSTYNQPPLQITATLFGDNITASDISIKHPKSSQPNHRFVIANENHWKLNQIQDAANHLTAALDILSSPPLRFDHRESKYDFHSADEVTQHINSVMSSLHKGRTALFVPKKRTIEELQSSRNMKIFSPPVPHEMAISFYVQSHKLMCSVYHIQKEGNHTKMEVFQAETSIPWLNEALALFTVCMQYCQQLKSKMAIFVHYNELELRSLTPEEDENRNVDQQKGSFRL